MLKKNGIILSVILAFVLISSAASASQMLLDGLPGTTDDRTSYGDLAMTRNDDGSSNLLNLPFEINFYGATYTQFYVNNNGNISFKDALGTYTPEAFPVADQPIIAPWWADVDTSGGDVYGDSVSNNVYASAPDAETLVVTWYNVGYYPSETDKINSFQLVLRDRYEDTGNEGDFDIEFRYNTLEWTTGSASGGANGLGGRPAQAGFDAGDGTNYYALPGSMTADVLELVNTSNVSEETPGLWSFAIRNGETPGTTSDNPLMPVVVDDTFNFDFNIDLNQQIFIDPVVAVGYDYEVTSGQTFNSVLLPVLGDNTYELYLWNGTGWVLAETLYGNNEYFFADDVAQFRILGIEASLGLDPDDATAFVTGLTFNEVGQVEMSMTPVTFDTDATGGNPVPEPGTFILMGFGLFGMSYLGRRKRKNL